MISKSQFLSTHLHNRVSFLFLATDFSPKPLVRREITKIKIESLFFFRFFIPMIHHIHKYQQLYNAYTSEIIIFFVVIYLVRFRHVELSHNSKVYFRRARHHTLNIHTVYKSFRPTRNWFVGECIKNESSLYH